MTITRETPVVFIRSLHFANIAYLRVADLLCCFSDYVVACLIALMDEGMVELSR